MTCMHRSVDRAKVCCFFVEFRLPSGPARFFLDYALGEHVRLLGEQAIFCAAHATTAVVSGVTVLPSPTGY